MFTIRNAANPGDTCNIFQRLNVICSNEASMEICISLTKVVGFVGVIQLVLQSLLITFVLNCYSLLLNLV